MKIVALPHGLISGCGEEILSVGRSPNQEKIGRSPDVERTMSISRDSASNRGAVENRGIP